MTYHLYHLLDANGEIVYVGMTRQPRQRLSNHLLTKPKVVKMRIVKSFEDSRECALAELLTMLKLRPEYNLSEIEVILGRHARQEEGIRLAKEAGKYRGRTKVLSEEQVKQAKSLVATGVPKARIARDFKVSRQTLYNALAEP